MFPGMPTPPTQTGGLAPEPVSGDSLTQFIRALSNYLQTQGQGTFNYGQQLTAAGAGGLNTASGTVQPAADYWKAILSGDPTKMSAAVAPTANAVGAQYDAASRTAATSMPRGGFSAGLQAALPFKKAADIGNMFETLQPTAATNLNTVANTQGNLAQILAQLGLGTSSQGQNLLNLVSQIQLGRRGQNVQEHGQAMGLGGQLGSSAISTFG